MIEQPSNKILSSAKEKWVIKSWKDMEGTQMSISKENKQDLKCYILCDSNYMTFWKRKNYGESERINFCQRLD